MRAGPFFGSITIAMLCSVACSDPETTQVAPDAPLPDAPRAFDIDLFGHVGHEFTFDVSEEQGKIMEQPDQNGGLGDIYDIGEDMVDSPTYANKLIVKDVATGSSHDFGKVEVRLVGQSTFRPWAQIPNIRVDTNEFQPDTKVGGMEHFRFNNGQVGGIYREAVAFAVWGALGYAVPQTTFAWAAAPTQWGNARVPYTLVEVYKESWCDRSPLLNGACENMWEFYGDFSQLLGHCQFETCDDTGLLEFNNRLYAAPQGPGFMEALSDILDWDAYHAFQCLSWFTATGDDYLHNSNNIVLLERTDGKFQLQPYSVDISAGQEWYPEVTLQGTSYLPMNCQMDPACWTALLAKCEALFTTFNENNVLETVIRPIVASVAAAGMQRRGDEDRASQLLAWYEGRVDLLRANEVWSLATCLADDACAGRPDGTTECRGGFCIDPARTCWDVACDKDEFCTEAGQCVPFPME